MDGEAAVAAAGYVRAAFNFKEMYAGAATNFGVVQLVMSCSAGTLPT
jgi:hypothetical protein